MRCPSPTTPRFGPRASVRGRPEASRLASVFPPWVIAHLGLVKRRRWLLGPPDIHYDPARGLLFLHSPPLYVCPYFPVLFIRLRKWEHNKKKIMSRRYSRERGDEQEGREGGRLALVSQGEGSAFPIVSYLAANIRVEEHWFLLYGLQRGIHATAPREVRACLFPEWPR